jgi:hypothetical protein
MSKWEFAIAVADEPEAHRKKEGDIIAVKPYPWQWGTKEQDAYMIVIVDGLTKDEAHNYCKPLYPNGETDENIIMEQNIKPIAKRRHSIPLDVLKSKMPELNFSKIRNKTLVYQPMKDKDFSIDLKATKIIKDKFTGKLV